MAYVQIPSLPAVIGLAGDELFEGVQAGTSVKISLNQIIAATRGGTPATIPIPVILGGTGAVTLTGYVKGSGTSPFTASSTIPNTDITGLGTMSTQNANAVAITGGSITGITDLAVADGGTGASTLTGYVKGSGTSPLTASATIPSGDITGLGTMSTQDASAVAITGGSITGITDLAVADGGTGQGAALTQYGVIYGSTTTAMASTAAGTATQVLHGNAAGAPTFSAVSLTADVSGTLPVANGGTNITSYTIGDILYASTSSVISRLADVATGNAIISGGVGVAPSYGKIGLTTHVSGTLDLGNGGTGVTTAPAAAAVLMGFTTTATATGTTVFTNTSSQFQVFTGTLNQTITLPVTSTLGTGWSFHIANNSTGTLTVNSSGGNLVISVIAGVTAMVTCIGTTLTTAADWEAGLTDFPSATGTGSVVLGTGPTITAAALNGTVGATTPSTGAFTTVTASTSVLSSGTGGVGYSTGAGVAVTQLTSRTTAAPTTGVSKSGAVTLFTTTAVVGTYFSFTVPNTGIAVTDTVVLSVRGATNTYVAFVTAITAATSFQVTMASVVGTASDTPIVNFTIIKGVSA